MIVRPEIALLSVNLTVTVELVVGRLKVDEGDALVVRFLRTVLVLVTGVILRMLRKLCL